MKTNIVKIILLTIIAILLSCILFVLLTKNKIGFLEFSSKEEFIKEETFDNNKSKIIINTYTADIEIKDSKDELIHVELYGKEESDYVVEESEFLKIEEKKKHRVCIGFCFSNQHIVVYLPINYDSSIELKTISGDIEAEKDLITNTVMNTTSGDIKLKKNKELKINTVSGDIEIDYATKIDFGTTSGDISIEELNLESDSSIATVSGDIHIKKTNEIYVDTNTVSGDIKIDNNNRHADIELKIKTTSGDIRIKN